MMTAKQRRQYLRNQIENASREQLVLMLYDGLLRFAEQGRTALLEKDNIKAHESLMRAQAILMELVNGLDREKGGDIAINLGQLYAYIFQRLVEANMAHSVEPIDESLHIVSDLRDAWSRAMREMSGEAGGSDETASGESKWPEAPGTSETTSAMSEAEAPTTHPAAGNAAGYAGALARQAYQRLSVQG